MPQFKGIRDQLEGTLQENVLTLLAVNDEFCKLVIGYVPLDLYSNEYMRDIAVQAYNYIQEYGKAPGVTHLRDLLESTLEPADKKDAKAAAKAELTGGILDNIEALAQNYNPEFVVNQLSKFIRQQELKKAVVAMYDAAESGDVEQAETVIDRFRSTTYTRFIPGLRLEEFVRVMDTDKRSQPCFQLGIPALDKQMLGPAKKELHMFMAPPKRGKTWWGLYCAKQALLQRQRVLVITLEVSAEIMASRVLQSFFSMSRGDVDELMLPSITKDRRGQVQGITLDRVADRLALYSVKGRNKVRAAFGMNGSHKTEEAKDQIGRVARNLMIQGFPTGQLKLKELEGYLDGLVAYEKFQPDVVVLDYPDLMYIDPRNYRLNVGLLNKDLRGLAVERNYALIAMSQSNRGSVNKRTVTETDAAEDFSKVAISDVVLTYSQIPAERELQVARLFVAAARNSRSKFTAYISQAYDIGQFCLESFDVASYAAYEKMLPKIRRNEQDDGDGDMGDDE